MLKDNDCEITAVTLKSKLKKGEAADDSDYDDEPPDNPLYAVVTCPKDSEPEKIKKTVIKIAV